MAIQIDAAIGRVNHPSNEQTIVWESAPSCKCLTPITTCSAADRFDGDVQIGKCLVALVGTIEVFGCSLMKIFCVEDCESYEHDAPASGFARSNHSLARRACIRKVGPVPTGQSNKKWPVGIGPTQSWSMHRPVMQLAQG